MNYHKLEQSLIDVVKEEQAKLGYRKEEIRLYYPLSSLNHFFGTEADAEAKKIHTFTVKGSYEDSRISDGYFYFFAQNMTQKPAIP